MRNKADTSSTGAGLAAPESRGSLPNSLDRLTEIKARVARYKEALSGMRRSNDSFWVSDLEYALAEIERLQWDVEAKDVEWKLQEEMKDKAVAERDALRGEVGRLTKERDEWASKWHTVRGELAELKYPGMKGIIRLMDGKALEGSK